MIRPGVRPVARLLTRPWFAALLFSITIAVWHLRPAYDLMMRNHDVHIATHLLFMVTATLMWWPVMSPLPELPRLPPLLAMLYLFLVGIPMQLVGALITFADEVLYPWYLAAPAHRRPFPPRRSAARRALDVDSRQSLVIRGDWRRVLQLGERGGAE